jgi:hypothetical protein
VPRVEGNGKKGKEKGSFPFLPPRFHTRRPTHKRERRGGHIPRVKGFVCGCDEQGQFLKGIDLWSEATQMTQKGKAEKKAELGWCPAGDTFPFLRFFLPFFSSFSLLTKTSDEIYEPSAKNSAYFLNEGNFIRFSPLA